MTILDKIIAAKKEEVEKRTKLHPISQLEAMAGFTSGTVSLKHRLLQSGQSGIIAEIKRRSPSKGVFKENLDVRQLAQGYLEAGATALSILTDQNFFGGSNQDLLEARRCSKAPILRKDFIISEYQVVEAKAIGADVVLLLATVLTVQEVKALASLARSLNMEVLLEVHTSLDLEETLCAQIDFIGVNNRDLRTFSVNPRLSFEIAEKIPPDFVRISESGLGQLEIIRQLRDCGYKGFLIGETFMKSEDPARACQELISALRPRVEDE